MICFMAKKTETVEVVCTIADVDYMRGEREWRKRFPRQEFCELKIPKMIEFLESLDAKQKVE